jgi:beta-lactam-binding protein with PASTA domain
VTQSGLNFTKNPVIVDLLAHEGFYFVIDNLKDLEFNLLGWGVHPNAGTIVSQSPAAGTSALKGTIIHVVVVPLYEHPGPPDD